MRSTGASLGGSPAAPAGSRPELARGGGQGVPAPIRCPFVVLELVMVAGVLGVAVPALVLGADGSRRRSRHYGRAIGADRVALVLAVSIQLLALLLVAVVSLV